MAKYVAKATVWLQIESDYPDGVGEAQHEVEGLVDLIKNCDDAKVSIARATDIEIVGGELLEFPGECVDELVWYDRKGNRFLLDDGMR